MTTGAPVYAYIEAEPDYVAAYGFNTATLTVTARDEYGHILTDYTDPLTLTTSLGTLTTTSTSPVNGLVSYTFTGGDTPGTALFNVAGFAASGASHLDVVDVIANINAEPAYLSAGGQTGALVTVTLQRPDGQPLTVIHHPLTVTTSLGSLSSSAATIDLMSAGYQVCEPVATAAEALRVLTSCRPDMVLADLRLAGPTSGLELAKQISSRNMPFMFVSGYSDPDTLRQASALNPAAIMSKPVMSEQVIAALDTCFNGTSANSGQLA
jgi:CheY-like chemotaxis protein